VDQQEKALPLLEASAQLEPTNASVRYRLAKLYRKMGRMDDTKSEVEPYHKYKDRKGKLRAVYKGLLIQPDETRADENPEEEPHGKN
jgi:tetratricopeptide repeat protein